MVSITIGVEYKLVYNQVSNVSTTYMPMQILEHKRS